MYSKYSVELRSFSEIVKTLKQFKFLMCVFEIYMAAIEEGISANRKTDLTVIYWV